MSAMEESPGCLDALEEIFRRVEEESERRAEEEQLLATRVALEKDHTAKKAKTRRRGSISISRLGVFSPSLPQGSQPPTPTQVSSLASSSPFYKAQIANASTSSIASGVSDDNAHSEDCCHVFQIEQIVPKSNISKIIPQRLSRARSTLMSSTGSNIDVSVHETTVHSSAPSGEGGSQSTSRRATVVARDGIRKQPPSMSSGNNGNWASRARSFTQKFRRKSTTQDPQSTGPPP